jgi:hypothetical protein
MPADARRKMAPTDEALDSHSHSPTDDGEKRTWTGDGWTARIIKNEDDDGWAVEMTADGATEPSLVGPWTMGRDKKNPKPLDASAFAVLVRGATEVAARSEAQRRATLHKSVTVVGPDGQRRVDMDIVPDDDDPHAILSVHDREGALLSRTRVAPTFKLTSDSARKWLTDGGSES